MVYEINVMSHMQFFKINCIIIETITGSPESKMYFNNKGTIKTFRDNRCTLKTMLKMFFRQKENDSIPKCGDTEKKEEQQKR